MIWNGVGCQEWPVDVTAIEDLSGHGVPPPYLGEFHLLMVECLARSETHKFSDAPTAWFGETYEAERPTVDLFPPEWVVLYFRIRLYNGLDGDVKDANGVRPDVYDLALWEVLALYGFLDVLKVMREVALHFFPLLGSRHLPTFMTKMK